MSFIKVYIHFVWSTKNRVPYFDTPKLRQKVWHHIKENAAKKNIFVDYINGYLEHCHCLVSLKANQSVSEVAKLLKGESSHWLNQQNLTESRFEWQDEYFAVSVSESMIEKTREYIKKQEEHHLEKTFEQEYKTMMFRYGFQKYSSIKMEEIDRVKVG